MKPVRTKNAVAWQCSSRTRRWEDRGRLPLAPLPRSADLVVTVQADDPRQDVIGWGGCFNESGWIALSVLPEAKRRAVLRALFADDGCRFAYCRMPIGANDYVRAYYSLNDHAGDYAMKHFNLARDREFLIPYIQAARQIRPELRIWGSPWTPPAWMKTNQLFCSGELTWTPANLRAYALYFAKYVRAYRAEGINVCAVHVQNEPLFPAVHPSCWWEGWQLRDFIRDYLGPRFRADGLDAEIWLGTINGETKYDVWENWVRPVLADPRANAFITGCGFQWYGNVAVLPARQQFPAKRLIQTETVCGDGANDWSYAEATFDRMRWYFERGANAYMQWNMVLDETGANTTGWKQCVMINVDRAAKRAIFNPQFYLVKHFSQYVRPGAQYLAASGSYPEQVAFRNPDGEVIVIAANTTDGPLRVTFAVAGHSVTPELPAHSFHTLRFPRSTEGGL